MDQSGEQRSRSITSESASASGFSQEFLSMLEPSSALVRRHEQDQHRVAAEKELKLQQQFEQLWLRIGRLEQYAQQSEVHGAALNQLLQTVEQDKTVLERRIQQLENENIVLRGRVTAHKRDDDAAAQDIGTPSDTATSSVRGTPNIASRTTVSDPVKLHPMLPGVLFIVNPEINETSDGSDFPLKLISSLRSILKDTMADEMINATKLAKVRNMPGSIKGRCLHRYLQKSQASQNKSIFTKEHEQSYACRTCVNKQRLCLSLTEGRVLVLSLHPVLRALSRRDGTARRPSELDYWVSVTKAPHNVDIWTVPAGQH